ncbi:hypothetical protein GOP47_0004712 [Adiantum capillus-veneris]|uniref:Uncharacterized protein n=1 Tax=Adiantum capillus-veneris TaxID=13818 RepID=A0A9D4V8L6_ADICA|nr:hypothetical protein GOP47_0004712 [Adiantum capillus-veneris]
MPVKSWPIRLQSMMLAACPTGEQCAWRRAAGNAGVPQASIATAMKKQVKVSKQLAPVILIPGAGGNQLEAKLTPRYRPSSWLCRPATFSLPTIFKQQRAEQKENEDGFFRLWLNVPGILPPFTTCFAERIRLSYNPETGSCENAPGVKSRVPYFGSTSGMAYLDPSFRAVSVYMAVLIEALEAEGYVDGETLFGAPYDFRYAPGKNASPVASLFLENLKSLIEVVYMRNGERPVVILSHSLGGLWGLYFLNQQTASWQQKYIGHFIPVSTPWGGTVQSMRIYASGYSEGARFIDPLVLRAEQRSSESNLWLLPAPTVFGDQVLVTTEKGGFSAFEIPKFLEDIGYPEGVFLYNSRIPPLINCLDAPCIPVTMVFSQGIDTPQMLVYSEKGFDEQPIIVNGDGDGTVNLCSLSAVSKSWNSVDGQDFKVIILHGKTHSTILTDKQSVSMLVDAILSSTLHPASS